VFLRAVRAAEAGVMVTRYLPAVFLAGPKMVRRAASSDAEARCCIRSVNGKRVELLRFIPAPQPLHHAPRGLADGDPVSNPKHGSVE
jgi:hypothetical protein